MNQRPRLLDLFCGAGGAGMGYHNAGFDVIGVDNQPQPNYPFDFVLTDALDVLDEIVRFGNKWDYAAIHASPPCQAHSTLGALWKDRDHPDLIQPTRELLEATGLPHVIENVVGAPLHHPFKLCGSSFGLGVWRHRIFETNWPIGMVPPCSHYEHPEPIDVTGVGGPGGRHRKPTGLNHAREVLGINWMTRKELSQAIPPAYTEFIGHQLLQHAPVAA